MPDEGRDGGRISDGNAEDDDDDTAIGGAVFGRSGRGAASSFEEAEVGDAADTDAGVVGGRSESSSASGRVGFLATWTRDATAQQVENMALSKNKWQS